jgi:Glycosyl hydrolases family 39
VLATILLVTAAALSPPAQPQAMTGRAAPVVDTFPWGSAEHARPHPGVLDIGVTHTQYSVDPWGNAAAITSAQTVLGATATYQNQHLFGWGALNPEPRPGVFDWSSLDRRMRQIRQSGGVPVITLCCAPDWMKGGRPGETDWSKLHDRPSPEHYQDFAALAVAVARRYRDVRYFQVWNELKGFWDNTLNRWDYESYTRFYNVVYDALKAFDPGLAVGGPYVVIDMWTNEEAGGRPSTLRGDCGTVDQRSLDVLEYWLRYKHGADFVAVDGGTVTRDGGPVSSAASSAVFGALTRWLRQRTSLPIWWSEFHVGRGGPDGQPRLVAASVAALMFMADEGADVALYWQPQEATADAGGGAPALWSTTERAGGGRPLPLAVALARAQQLLADPADDLVSWPVEQVGILHGRRAFLAVNTSSAPVTVRVQGLLLRLTPYEVRYVPLPPGTAPPPPGWWRPTDRCLSDQPEAR